MQKLFAISNTRTLQRLGLSPQSFPNFQKALHKNNIKATGQNLLFRIPRVDFRILINTHCPINRYSAAKEALKAQTPKKQQKRQSCQDIKLNSNRFLKNCRWAKRPLENVQYDNTLRDLLIFLYGLHTLQMGQKYYPMYLRVYKMNDYLMPIIDDLSKGGAEFQLFCKTRKAIIDGYVQSKAQPVAQSRENQEEELARRAQEFQRLSGLGRDFSYDEYSEFDHALSKKQKVQSAQIDLKLKQPTVQPQQQKLALKVEKINERSEQIIDKQTTSNQSRRRRRAVQPQYIQTDNLKLNVIRKGTETSDQRNHPRFEQLRRKIQLQYGQQHKQHPNISYNKKQSIKSDRSSSQNRQKQIKYKRQQNQLDRK